MYLGAHVSIAGGVQNAPLNAQKIGAETFQIFSRSPRGGKSNITTENIQEFKNNLKKFKFKNFYIHAPYYINLASSNNRIRHGSIGILKEELRIGNELGATAMMTHLGSASDYTDEEALNLVTKGIKEILKDYSGKTKFLIEISAGSGRIIGDSFEEIGKIIKEVKNKSLGVCFDTCHAFASGYDLRTKEAIENTFKDFDKKIGLKNLVVLHLNDSLVELNSRKDRHADIGHGLIGKKAFAEMMTHQNLKKIDCILETPELKSSYSEQLKQLMKMRDL